MSCNEIEWIIPPWSVWMAMLYKEELVHYKGWEHGALLKLYMETTSLSFRCYLKHLFTFLCHCFFFEPQHSANLFLPPHRRGSCVIFQVKGRLMRSSRFCHRCERGGVADASSHLKFPTESHLNDGIVLHPDASRFLVQLF